MVPSSILEFNGPPLRLSAAERVTPRIVSKNASRLPRRTLHCNHISNP